MKIKTFFIAIITATSFYALTTYASNDVHVKFVLTNDTNCKTLAMTYQVNMKTGYKNLTTTETYETEKFPANFTFLGHNITNAIMFRSDEATPTDHAAYWSNPYPGTKPIKATETRKDVQNQTYYFTLTGGDC